MIPTQAKSVPAPRLDRALTARLRAQQERVDGTTDSLQNLVPINRTRTPPDAGSTAASAAAFGSRRPWRISSMDSGMGRVATK